MGKEKFLLRQALEYIDRIRQINVLNGNQNKGFLFLTEDGTIITRDALDGQLRRGCAYAGIPIRSMHKIRKPMHQHYTNEEYP